MQANFPASRRQILAKDAPLAFARFARSNARSAINSQNDKTVCKRKIKKQLKNATNMLQMCMLAFKNTVEKSSVTLASFLCDLLPRMQSREARSIKNGLIDYLKNQHRKGAKKIAVCLKIASEKA